MLDLGGATGDYAFRLSAADHAVTLADLSERHIQIARGRNRAATAPLRQILTANALEELPFADQSFDLVLNLGPLYHLPDPADRLRELREVARVLSEQGLAISAYINRFVSLFDGYKHGTITDPEFDHIVREDLATGVHDGPPHDRYFTLAYLHRPEEIEPELEKAGLEVVEVVAVEGFFYLYPGIARYCDDEAELARRISYAERLEKEPSLIGATDHLLSVARKPPAPHTPRS